MEVEDFYNFIKAAKKNRPFSTSLIGPAKDLAFFPECLFFLSTIFSQKCQFWKYVFILWNRKATSGINKSKSADFVYKQFKSKTQNGRTLKNTVNILSVLFPQVCDQIRPNKSIESYQSK